MIRPLMALAALLVTTAAEAQQAATTTTVKFGINGHDGRKTYPLSGIEARLQWMQANHLTSYRTDVGVTDTAILDQLLPLAKKYGVTVRPMLYPGGSQQAVYTLVARYKDDIKIWEIGNEMDGDRSKAQANINAALPAVKGVVQAGLQTAINIMSCNNDGASQCQGDPNGDVWFLDMAKASGWNFNVVTFHYYPRMGEVGYWMDKYFGQMRAAASKFNVPIFFNETNCGEIYDGVTNGSGNCNTSLQQNLNEVVTKYADIVKEVNVYEMLDQSDMSGVERYFGVCYAMGNCKPTSATLASFAAMTSGGSTPVPPDPINPIIPPGYTGTMTGTFTGTITLSPVPAK